MGPPRLKPVVRHAATPLVGYGVPPGHGNGFNGDIARALNAAGIDARPVPWDATDPAGFDVTDLFTLHGDAEAKRLLRARIEAVKAGEPWRDPKLTETSREQSPCPNGGGGAQPVMTCLADVMPEEVTWTWPARVASGKLNLLVGDPGLGKSFITLEMVARYTTGRAWPDGSPGGSIGSAISRQDMQKRSVQRNLHPQRPLVARTGRHPAHCAGCPLCAPSDRPSADRMR